MSPGPNSSLESYPVTVSCSGFSIPTDKLGTPMAPPPAIYHVYGNRQTDKECYLGHPQVQQEQAQLVDPPPLMLIGQGSVKSFFVLFQRMEADRHSSEPLDSRLWSRPIDASHLFCPVMDILWMKKYVYEYMGASSVTWRLCGFRKSHPAQLVELICYGLNENALPHRLIYIYLNCLVPS